MCIFKAPSTSKMAIPPAVTPRVETDSTLPTKKDVVAPDTKADVSYGTSAKKSGPAAGKRTGVAALSIDLNTGPDTNKTGGLNV